LDFEEEPDREPAPRAEERDFEPPDPLRAPEPLERGLDEEPPGRADVEDFLPLGELGLGAAEGLGLRGVDRRASWLEDPDFRGVRSAPD